MTNTFHILIQRFVLFFYGDMLTHRQYLVSMSEKGPLQYCKTKVKSEGNNQLSPHVSVIQ
jgi:hypothetical protein